MCTFKTMCISTNSVCDYCLWDFWMNCTHWYEMYPLRSAHCNLTILFSGNVLKWIWLMAKIKRKSNTVVYFFDMTWGCFVSVKWVKRILMNLCYCFKHAMKLTKSFIRQCIILCSVRDALLHPPQISWTELFDHSYYIIDYFSITMSK